MAVGTSLRPKPLASSLWKKLTSLGLSRCKPTRRGCRAGRRKCYLITTILGHREQNEEMVSEYFTGNMDNFTNVDAATCTLNIQSGIHTGLNIQSDTSGTHNPNNVIVVNQNPMQRSKMDPKLKLCLANVRSIKSKSAALLDYIVACKADLFAITETWLTPLDVAAQLEIVPPGYSFVHRPRTGRVGGGLGLLYKYAIAVSKVEDGEKESFEFSEWRIATGIFKSRLVLLYRPPYSEEHPVSMATFLSEFSGFMESIILAPEPLIILGNFNIHVDRGSECNDAA